MPSITIRNVPQAVRDELASRAAKGGRSLQEYLHGEMIRLANKPDIDSIIARVSHRVHSSGTTLPSEKILEYLKEDRR